jgi:hypothetical protein
MKLSNHFIFLPFLAVLAIGQPGCLSKSANTSDEPESVVRGLYKEVVNRHPIGIPEGEDMKTLLPYLSKGLLHKMDEAQGCFDDFSRREHQDPTMKPSFNWLEAGLFSGFNERISPRIFQIEKIEKKNGSFHIYVKLSWKEPDAPEESWRVVAIVVQEKDRYVVDDVLFPKEKESQSDYALSLYLSAGCKGPRWVGFGNK